MELISIHLPKTAGTSFYAVLQQVYGDKLSISYRRRDVKLLAEAGQRLGQSLSPTIEAIHGHFTFEEIRELYQPPQTKLICWMRDPIDRIVSNYRFFMGMFENPDRNRKNYEKNKHRAQETLEEYASRAGVQNKMSQFIDKVPLSEFYFIGFLETFAADLERLAQRLSWTSYEIPHLNSASRKATPISDELRQQLMLWNRKDIALYCEACRLNNRPIPTIYQTFLTT